jgi:hypothetical protein
MATTFKWAVANLERHTADGIVYTVHYTVSAGDGTYDASAYGSIGLEAPAEGDTPIPFASLTEEIVVGWVQDHFGAEKIAEVFAALQAELDEQHAPSKALGTPW